ncbi:MAG: toprim domain-containing protein [bacterium]
MSNIEIKTLRELDLKAVMDILGYEPDRKASDTLRTVYETPVGKISIMGLKFFNFSNNFGNGGAIDLVMHLKGLSFSEAINFLKNIYYSEPAYSEKNNIPLFLEHKNNLELPAPDYAKKDILIKYLHGKRKIPLGLINSMLCKKAIYPNKYGSAVFLHCFFVQPYNITGATIRGTKNDFKQTVGNKSEGLFWFGKNIKEAAQIILTESPIDLISYYCLKSASPEDCYISLSGISFPSSLSDFLKNKNIILATDNPAYEKSEAAREANLKLEKELKRIGGIVIREIPQYKNWNEDLIYKGMNK